MPIELVRINETKTGHTVILEDTDDTVRDEVINPGTDDERQVIEYQRFTAFIPAKTDPADIRGILQAALDKTDDRIEQKDRVRTRINNVIANINRRSV